MCNGVVTYDAVIGFTNMGRGESHTLKSSVQDGAGFDQVFKVQYYCGVHATYSEYASRTDYEYETSECKGLETSTMLIIGREDSQQVAGMHLQPFFANPDIDLDWFVSI